MLEKIMNDKEISAIIENVNNVIIVNNCGCHGLGHVKRVMNYVDILLCGLDVSEHEIELGKIAAYLHDIGAIMGKQGHAERSAIYVRNYLQKLNMSNDDIDIIVDAIKNHSSGSLSMIGASLTFADKIDMQKNRMLRFIDGNDFHENVKHILDIKLNVNQDNIIVNIMTDGMFEYKSLSDYPKMIIKPVEMAKYLNRKCLFMIDGNVIDLFNYVSKNSI